MSRPGIVPMPSRSSGASGPIPHAPQRFLSLRDVLDRLTISRSLLYELIKDPVQPFPAPVHLGRRSVWVEGEVEEYMIALVEKDRQLPQNGR
ncbi:AlpA family transcriptional regulator [Hyphomonas sp.]|jgi:predicted DNA-binding transcriptional regulator AlpA|uniref:helix-turn-helix transcriptional regulator n=1 Tax=Hyphomonas sp. TaxID=87 RepID=UPI0025B8CED8|nr:AlpA family phage regulatory protein [Hyphomonas sp.]|tara:strand:- start:231 stop:506 length:276 start_codon:yes stop_codon:yes gene_type:complete